jgi:DNA-directed RNA polymerase specialized sigma24 family protein
MLPNDTEMGGSQKNFPTTHWSMLAAVCGEMTDAHRAVLNLLIQRYWKPVYCYLRRRGYANETAKDLTQEFFTTSLTKSLFGRASSAKGRFRTFLLACLDNFLKNARRAEHARRRRPPMGVIALDDLIGKDDMRFEPSDHDTPQAAFERAWGSSLLIRVAEGLERECQEAGRMPEYDLFCRRILQPAMEGIEAPGLSGLAQELGLTEKQAANRLVTARRAFQRLLREEIRTFASSEDDVAAEVRDLFQFLGRT